MCNMQVLGLNNNKIGNPGLAALADAVGKGALAQCAYLYLHQNQIGDAGLSALATAITPGPSGKGPWTSCRCAGAPLTCPHALSLGIHALLTHTFCWMWHTQVLGLSGNQIGDAGLSALAEAVGKGALAQLTHLFLERNQIGDMGMLAFADAVSSGALPALKSLLLHSNKIGDPGMQTLADAVAKGALDHLTVRWRPIALSPCLETWQVHSPD
jgi:hypothetical protein